VAGARQQVATKTTSASQYSKPRRQRQPPPCKPYAVAGGCVAAGVVIPCGGATRWRAVNAQGGEVGIFGSLQEAVAALPSPKVLQP